MLLKGKKAIITGGSKGIGTAIALEMAKEGAHIALTYRRHEKAAIAIQNTILNMDRKAIAHQCDTASFEAVSKVIKEMVAELGGVDILVNNAGMNWDGVSWKMKEEQWDRVIEVNLKGYFNFIRHTVPYLKEQKAGKIINITSINGLRGKFGQTNYAASKSGIIGLTKALSKELGAFNINVNAVAPGLIETDMLKESDAREKIIQMAMDEMALKRIGQKEDIAYLVAFLASEKAKHITGEIIKVDGGQYI